jgi:hypothetical protein
MVTGRHSSRRRYLQNGISVLGIVSLTLLATLTLQPGWAPLPMAAQSTQAKEVRATSFVLVGDDGTIRARLGPEHGIGVGLSLFDPTGQNRLVAIDSGDGQNPPGLVIFDADGQTKRLALGVFPDRGPVVSIFDSASAAPRALFGQRQGVYGVSILDTNGQPVATFP